MLHPAGGHDFEAVQPGAATVLGAVSFLRDACRPMTRAKDTAAPTRDLGRYCLSAYSRPQPASARCSPRATTPSKTPFLNDHCETGVALLESKAEPKPTMQDSITELSVDQAQDGRRSRTSSTQDGRRGPSPLDLPFTAARPLTRRRADADSSARPRTPGDGSLTMLVSRSSRRPPVNRAPPASANSRWRAALSSTCLAPRRTAVQAAIAALPQGSLAPERVLLSRSIVADYDPIRRSHEHAPDGRAKKFDSGAAASLPTIKAMRWLTWWLLIAMATATGCSGSPTGPVVPADPRFAITFGVTHPASMSLSEPILPG
jgi:hypothetical protein